MDNRHSARIQPFYELEKQPPGTVLHNSCSKEFQKFLGKHPWQCIIFDLTNKNTPP